jgi:tetratricopeptide (TPR) repeat protein
MKKTFLLGYCLLLLRFTGSIAGSGTDSLVYWSDLSFHSDFEKQAFADFFSGKTEAYFPLFLSVSRNVDQAVYARNQQVYAGKLAQINEQTAKSKTETKRIKAVFGSIHDSFLRKYEMENHFEEIFTTGQYNCVSATALYGMLFQEMNIPFIIKETPTHVYLVAYPQTSKILIETTDPTKGYLVFDERLKTSFVNSLKAGKLISEQEVKSKSINELFEQYYFTQENITLRQLVGIQYTNDALYKLDKKRYPEAFAQLEKAYLFYPSTKVAYLLLFTAATILDKSEYTDEASVKYLAKLSRYRDVGMSTERFLAEFSRITNLYLINASKPAQYDKIYQQLSENIRDEEVRSELAFLYHHERGRILYNQGKYNGSLLYLEKAYVQKPDNVDMQSLYVTAIGQSLRTQNDGRTLLSALQAYETRHPRLTENDVFFGLLMNAYLLASGQSYELNKIPEGEKWRAEFEKRSEGRDMQLVNAELIGRTYSLAAVHYFRQGNDAKAKNILNRGLALDPDNYELTRRLQMIR